MGRCYVAFGGCVLVFDAVLPAGVTGRIRGQIIMQILFLVNIFFMLRKCVQKVWTRITVS